MVVAEDLLLRLGEGLRVRYVEVDLSLPRLSAYLKGYRLYHHPGGMPIGSRCELPI